MYFEIVTLTDVGIKKEVNQDCIFAERYATNLGEAVFAILCDGMGGLSHGEWASSTIVSAFIQWADQNLPRTTREVLTDRNIREQWSNLISELNTQIREYGVCGGFSVGSTVTAILITQERFFILNIGDSRAYQIDRNIQQITIDNTVIEEEIRMGNLTYEQAMESPIKNVLTRCVGVARSVYPDMFFGTPKRDCVYLLCSDGFRHRISSKEIRDQLCPAGDSREKPIEERIKYLVDLNKMRGETDNISAIVISAH